MGVFGEDVTPRRSSYVDGFVGDVNGESDSEGGSDGDINWEINNKSGSGKDAKMGRSTTKVGLVEMLKWVDQQQKWVW